MLPTPVCHITDPSAAKLVTCAWELPRVKSRSCQPTTIPPCLFGIALNGKISQQLACSIVWVTVEPSGATASWDWLPIAWLRHRHRETALFRSHLALASL